MSEEDQKWSEKKVGFSWLTLLIAFAITVVLQLFVLDIENEWISGAMWFVLPIAMAAIYGGLFPRK